MTARRLLIVDDERDFAEFVRIVGERAGYDVRIAASGREFKQLYDSFQPGAVVVDMVMPAMDGIELVQWLADRRSTARVLVISGQSMQYPKMAQRLGEDLGLSVVVPLNKPISVATLSAALD